MKSVCYLLHKLKSVNKWTEDGKTNPPHSPKPLRWNNFAIYASCILYIILIGEFCRWNPDILSMLKYTNSEYQKQDEKVTRQTDFLNSKIYIKTV